MGVAGVVDAGVVDAGVVDAGVVDAGVVVAGVVVAGVVVAGVVVAGVVVDGDGAWLRLVVMLVEQTILLPPPLVEPLHWLILTGSEALTVPDAIQLDGETSPPPLPEPLH